MTEKSNKKKQWLWFIAIYIASIVAVAGISYLLKLLIPH